MGGGGGHAPSKGRGKNGTLSRKEKIALGIPVGKGPKAKNKAQPREGGEHKTVSDGKGWTDKAGARHLWPVPSFCFDCMAGKCPTRACPKGFQHLAASAGEFEALKQGRMKKALSSVNFDQQVSNVKKALAN